MKCNFVEFVRVEAPVKFIRVEAPVKIPFSCPQIDDVILRIQFWMTNNIKGALMRRRYATSQSLTCLCIVATLPRNRTTGGSRLTWIVSQSEINREFAAKTFKFCFGTFPQKSPGKIILMRTTKREQQNNAVLMTPNREIQFCGIHSSWGSCEIHSSWGSCEIHSSWGSCEIHSSWGSHENSVLRSV